MANKYIGVRKKLSRAGEEARSTPAERRSPTPEPPPSTQAVGSEQEVHVEAARRLLRLR
jgi:hypothetical protein